MMTPLELETVQHQIRVNEVVYGAALASMENYVTLINMNNGWFDSERSFGDDIALLHSEVSEMFEGFRDENWSKEKGSVQDEAADILIRLVDTCYRHKINLAAAFVKKCVTNSERPYRHGGKAV